MANRSAKAKIITEKKSLFRFTDLDLILMEVWPVIEVPELVT